MGRGKGSVEAAAADLNSAAIHLLRGLRAADRRSGLTAARLSALSVLVFGGPHTLTRLAEAEGVTPPTMTRIVDGLCQLGLGSRERHPDHPRMVVVRATAEGERLMQAARHRRIEVIAAALRTLEPAEREAIEAVTPALLTLAAGVPIQAERQAGP